MRVLVGVLSIAVALSVAAAPVAHADPCDSYDADFNLALCAVQLATAPDAEDHLVVRPALLMVGALEPPMEPVATAVDAEAQALADQQEHECVAALITVAAGNVRIATRIIEMGGTLRAAKKLVKAGDAEGAADLLVAGTAATFELQAIADACG